MRTIGVKQLAHDGLEIVSQPYSSNVTDEVFCVIERIPMLKHRFDAVCRVLGKDIVNKWL